MIIAQNDVVANTRDIYSLLLILIVVAAAIGLFGFWLYRRLTRPLTEDEPEAGFTLSDLRRLHKEGQISDEEFARARGRLIAGVKLDAADGGVDAGVKLGVVEVDATNISPENDDFGGLNSPIHPPDPPLNPPSTPPQPPSTTPLPRVPPPDENPPRPEV